jgi:Ca2+-binding RTX toxin-like protein
MKKYKGHDYPETIQGSNQSDLILGMAGDDVLYGRSGNDKIYGGSGNDYIYGEKGSDKLFGEAGNDNLALSEGSDELNGGAGRDRLLGYDIEADLEIDFSTGEASYEFEGITHLSKFKSIEGVVGGYGNDVIRADDLGRNMSGFFGDDLIEGGEGIDGLDGGSGTDTLHGGGGDDFLTLRNGNDVLDGGDGQDTIDFYAVQTGVTYTVTDASVTFTDDNGTWTSTLSGMENAWGSWSNDTLTGDEQTNILVGFAGNDTISGLGGDDILCGAHGNDELTGGEGIDLFVFAYMDYATGEDDVITDFSVADDGIMLDAGKFSGLVGKGTVEERGHFEFRALKASQFQSSEDDFAHGQGIRLFYESDTGTLFYDHDGSKTKIHAVAVAHLDPDLELTAADLFVGTPLFG